MIIAEADIVVSKMEWYAKIFTLINGASSAFGVAWKLRGPAQKWSKQLWKRFRKGEGAVHDEEAATTANNIAENREVVKALKLMTDNSMFHGGVLG